MTNQERWQIYTNGLSSPQNFISWGWLYTVAASLQRRVWMGPPHQPCFPNMYVILVGKPGIGKGLVIREVAELLKFWKQDQKIIITSTNKVITDEEKQLAQATADAELRVAQEREFQGSVKGQDISKPLLIPVCADAITYEALVNAVSESYRRVNYTVFDEKQQKDIVKIYGHSSLCFILQELGSLMRKKTNDTINYLLGLYDCPVDYEYITLTRGKDRVKRGCLNIIAGTTPSFMQSTFDEKLTDEGFSSRTFYIYSKKNRKNQFWIPALSEEQKQHKIHLLNHIRNLSALYGSISIDQETVKFLEEWWDEQESNQDKRANKSTKLAPYYSRKNIHVMKVAMAMHFSESVMMHIPKETFVKAIEFLEKEELNMHMALSVDGNNPHSKVINKILPMLETGSKKFIELLIELHTVCDKKTLEEALTLLQETGQIKMQVMEDEDTQQQIAYYSLTES